MTYIKLTKTKSLALFLLLIFTIGTYAQNSGDVSVQAQCEADVIYAHKQIGSETSGIYSKSAGVDVQIATINSLPVAWISGRTGILISNNGTCISTCMFQDGTSWQDCYWTPNNLFGSLSTTPP